MKKRKYYEKNILAALSYIPGFLMMLVIGTIFSLSVMPMCEALWLKILVQTFSILMVMSGVYGSLWDQGDHDRNAVEFGRMKKDIWRGLKISLWFMVPFMLLSLLLVADLLWNNVWFSAAYRIIYSYLLLLINALLTPGEAPTVGGILAVTSLQLLIPLVGTVAYILGYRGIILTDKLVYKNKKKKK